MKKFIWTIGLLLILLPITSFAANQDTGQNNGQTSQPSSSPSSTQNQNTTQTNNPETGVMTQEQTNTQLQSELQESMPSYSPKGQFSQERMSQISLTLESMVMLSNRLENSNIKEQINSIAHNQANSEDMVNQSLDKAESRSKVAKFFVGPNYKELKNVKQEIEQNRLRIEELNRIMSQITNQTDKTELQNQIQILEIQNTSLEEELDIDIQGFSLFGWLSKSINKY
ncbi:MAG: hypothetical protein WCV58_00605 [Patescibacteria group bacterium]|jgi:hypothetical protein